MKTNKIVLLDDDPNYIRLFAEAYAEAAPEGDELVTFGSEDVCTEYIRRSYFRSRSRPSCRIRGSVLRRHTQSVQQAESHYRAARLSYQNPA